jgi:hypothetical protein
MSLFLICGLLGHSSVQLRASRGLADGYVHAVALRRHAVEADAAGPAKWARIPSLRLTNEPLYETL